MFATFSLRSRLICIFVAMATIVVVCCAGLLWNIYQVNAMFGRVVQKDLVLYKKIQDMELALANQKGFLTYYFVDEDAKWLELLTSYRNLFQDSLEFAASLDLAPAQALALEKISSEYTEYLRAKDYAINNYMVQKSDDVISLPHKTQRDVYFSLLDLCKEFREFQWGLLMETERKAVMQSNSLKIVAWISILFFFALCVMFLFILYRQILGPIRTLAIETGSNLYESSIDEVSSLKRSLRGMMRDFDATHDELLKSRKNLRQAERMAMVGELAAGVAHTIRNPFTSIKMRMFSLSRSINLTPPQNEDLQVISGEINRIDKVLTNFLGFARPPKLMFTECSMVAIVEELQTLLHYPLKEHNTLLVHEYTPGLPNIRVDSDRIKEALLNLITNSCEAMEAGGRIIIRETREQDIQLGEVAVISVKDTGPGIPESLISKVTTPFFTTRENGSGLGLAIVARIVREHGGRVQITTLSDGCEIVLILPV